MRIASNLRTGHTSVRFFWEIHKIRRNTVLKFTLVGADLLIFDNFRLKTNMADLCLPAQPRAYSALGLRG